MDPSQRLALGRRQPRSPRALAPTRSLATQAAVGRKALRWGLEGHGLGTEWRRRALRTQVWRKEVTRWPARAEAGERWVWAEVWRAWRDQKPTGRHCLPVTLPLALLPLSNTLLSGFLLSPFQRRCLLFPSLPGCFHFFCLKFLRGRFYFQRFD